MDTNSMDFLEDIQVACPAQNPFWRKWKENCDIMKYFLNGQFQRRCKEKFIVFCQKKIFRMNV